MTISVSHLLKIVFFFVEKRFYIMLHGYFKGIKHCSDANLSGLLNGNVFIASNFML